MEPAPSYQPEFTPRQQWDKYQRLGEPIGVPLVQHTTVMVTNPGAPPRDHIIWSIFNLIYMNPFCLGLAALYFSIKSRDRKVAGDLDSAREYGSTARCFNITALTLILISTVILIIIYTILTMRRY